MKTSNVQRERDLPDYVSSCIGKPDLGSIANRVRELAAFMSAQEHEEVAGHLVQAYGALLGVMAARSAGTTTCQSQVE
ncbi:MAG TPA: hypothetical protein PKG54_12425 [Phycisphaerae bacterium]|jgi:hypothetical protein|nr:hypothetical protein [Phycisphaerae bacterium]HOB75316.1 hypothetical protein [Phycisphaerae bacterium]HOJ53248.1 hypothetical protein [Phycisphaerae bacterium]HOL25212.1 hypothetical protein [Phycisphaerae bacterium]HPP20234.1 hypothetical protein [Phycisphaerae bacterium]